MIFFYVIARVGDHKQKASQQVIKPIVRAQYKKKQGIQSKNNQKQCYLR